jgi:threonine/homoserine/homoserine lactone efflux protein
VFNLGSVTSDAIYAFGVYFGLATLLTQSVPLRLALWLLGGAWLCWLGVDALRARIDLSVDSAALPATSWHEYRAGLLITLFNPLTIIGWIALAGSFFTRWDSAWPSLETVGALAVAAMLVGAMAWFVLLSLAFSAARRWVSPRAIRIVSVVSGLALIAYGLSAWWAALEVLLAG